MQAEAELGKPRGILNLKTSAPKFQLARYLPSEDINPFVEYYWTVSWDLRGQPPHVNENLSHPVVHLVFDRGKTAVIGIVQGKFTYALEGQGQVFGIRFRAGGFYPFIKSPVSAFTNARLSIEEIFGVNTAQLEETILSQPDEMRQRELVEDFLRTHLPEPDPNVSVVEEIVRRISNDRAIIKVDDLVEHYAMTKRTLQRLFSQYVGVNPKWVIKCYRLQEAAEQLADGAVSEWSKLAVDLGYFDQAHFIKDFKAIVGKTPAEYAKKNEQ
jgi:AraC-like DNA-binding protein